VSILIDIENLIWLIGPSVGAAILLVISRLSGLLNQRLARRIAVSSGLVCGFLGLVIGPRCMCRNVYDSLLGAAIFAIFFGAGMSLLLALGSGLFYRWRGKARAEVKQ
jgi:hypothetical protein